MTTITKGQIPENAIMELKELSQRAEFKKLLYVPNINWVIILTCMASLIAWVSLSYFWLAGDLSAVWLAVLSTYTFFIFILSVHEASHFTILRNRKYNDMVMNILTFIPYPHIPVSQFRHQHLQHHKTTASEGDPDDYLYSGPWIVRVLKVCTHDFYWIYWCFKNRHDAPKTTNIYSILGFSAYIAILAVGFSSNYAYEFFIMYFMPQRIGVAVAIYMFAYVQHTEKCEPKEKSPFKTTVVMRGVDTLFAKIYFGQNRHLIHHLYPHMPIYRNWKAWQLGKDVFERQSLVNVGFNAEYFTQNNDKNAKAAKIAKGMLAVTIVEINTVASGIKSYKLVPSDLAKKLPTFNAGAHVDVEIDIGLVRQYSLYNADNNGEFYTIAVQYEKNGRGGSKRLHESFIEGKEIFISQPRNLFELNTQNIVKDKDVLLFAGGIGITPILSMAWQLYKQNISFQLHYSMASNEKWAFKEQWHKLPFQAATFIHIDNDSSSEKLQVSNLFSIHPQADIYVCGPDGFMNYIKSSAEEANIPCQQFHQESFNNKIDNSNNHEFTVKLKRSNQEFVIPKDQSIVNVLKEHKIFIPVSCENGICGTCKCKVITGDIDHRDLVLEDREKGQQKLFTPCVSRASGKAIEIDF